MCGTNHHLVYRNLGRRSVLLSSPSAPSVSFVCISCDAPCNAQLALSTLDTLPTSLPRSLLTILKQLPTDAPLVMERTHCCQSPNATLQHAKTTETHMVKAKGHLGSSHRRLIPNERTCKYTAFSVCLSFGNLICGAALLFITLHSVLLHSPINTWTANAGTRRRFRSDSTPSLRRCRRHTIHILSTLLTRLPSCAYSRSKHDFFARLSLLLQHYRSPPVRISLSLPCLVDTYPFCRVKPEDLSEREVGKGIYICAYPCALRQGESHE